MVIDLGKIGSMSVLNLGASWFQRVIDLGHREIGSVLVPSQFRCFLVPSRARVN